MLYFVKGEFVEENNAGKPIQQIKAFVDGMVVPSLEALEKAMQEKKITGGLGAGAREGFFILDASSNEDVGGFLRSLPFWVAFKWTVVPLQSPRSAIEQDKASMPSGIR